MDCKEVRNIIVKLDRAAHLSDTYHQNNRMYANTAQTKACKACGKKGHMTASCPVPKTKLNCKHCNMKESHALKKRKKTKRMMIPWMIKRKEILQINLQKE